MIFDFDHQVCKFRVNKRKGSTNLETTSDFSVFFFFFFFFLFFCFFIFGEFFILFFFFFFFLFLFFFQYWVFFRSVHEKLTSVVVVGLQKSEVSEFEVGSFFSSSSLTDFRL